MSQSTLAAPSGYEQAEGRASNPASAPESHPKASIRPVTPPGQQGTTSPSSGVVKDSPRSLQKATNQEKASLADIRRSLAALLMPAILYGGKDTWLRHYTSNRIGKEEITKIITALQASGEVLKDEEDRFRWKSFPAAPSTLAEKRKADGKASSQESNQDTAVGTAATGAKDSPAVAARSWTERQIFRSLGPIVNAIADVSLSGYSAACKYKEEPYSTDSEVPGSQHYIDGCLYLLESTSPRSNKRLPTSDVAVNFEYKVHATDVDVIDNRWKAIYSAYHNLHNDCRRTHTYSITIEDNNVSLWYFSRSHSAKSEPFDLLDVSAVVWALSALIFSTVEELGYDPDIRRVAEKDDKRKQHIRYVYRLGNCFYKTLKCLDEYDDLVIIGRATRVWEVIQVHGFDHLQAVTGATHAVLRDVWLDHGGATEGETQKKIFERCEEVARNFPRDDDPRLIGVDDATRNELRDRLVKGTYKELFLTIEADHRGAKSKTVAEGFVVASKILEHPEYINKSATKRGADAHRTNPSRSDTRNPATSAVELAKRDFNPKQRSFVVYKEVCHALHDVDDLHTVVQALLDCLLALQILFLICWVHRDVSSGNILLHGGHGKLGDLEYAKEFNLNVPHRSSDPKTGTAIFMAVEVSSGRVIYTPRKTVTDGISAPRAADAPHVPVRHHFQHDLESIFWIITWIMVTRLEGDWCQDVANRLFYSKGVDSSFNRHDFLCKEDFFEMNLQGLRAGQPSNFYAGLLTMRDNLHDAYLERKYDFGDKSFTSPLYRRFRLALEHIAAAAPPGAVRLVRPPPRKYASQSGYASRTNRVEAKVKEPDLVMLSPHKAMSLKRERELSDGTAPDEEARPEKRCAHD